MGRIDATVGSTPMLLILTSPTETICLTMRLLAELVTSGIEAHDSLLIFFRPKTK
jgi:hypothetical protein